MREKLLEKFSKVKWKDLPYRTIICIGFFLALMFFAGKGLGYLSYQSTFSDKSIIYKQEWGMGFGEPGEQPRGDVAAEELIKHDAYYMGNAEEKVIYLTFDCGFENGNTPAILDALKKHNVQGTFFVVGHFVESAPDLVKRMVTEGHTVGNHTFHHPDITTMDEAAIKEEVDSVAQKFKEVTGEEMSMYFRPPQGRFTLEKLDTMKALGYQTIFWSLAYGDWDQNNQPSHEAAIEKLTKRIHPGAVVLLHNTSKTNGEILDELLTKWEEMGYTFKPLSDLVIDAKKTYNNS